MKPKKGLYGLPLFTRRIGLKGQMPVPKAICRTLGLKPGDKMTFVVENDYFVARRIRSAS